jgi:signal transduction histidine kinase
LQLEVDNLNETINQVLDFSNIDRGTIQLNMENYSMVMLVRNAEKFFYCQGSKTVKFDYHIEEGFPEWLKFDHKRITQVISNMILNLVKFSDSGLVKLGIFGEKENNNRNNNKEIKVKILISNTPDGTRPDNQKTIFFPCSQLQKIEAEKYSVIGMGISICRGIIEMHGGEMGLDSSPEKGTKFWFTFRALIPEEKMKEQLNYHKESFISHPHKSFKNLEGKLVYAI